MALEQAERLGRNKNLFKGLSAQATSAAAEVCCSIALKFFGKPALRVSSSACDDGSAKQHLQPILRRPQFSGQALQK